jgi:two-component sensor histidine kinase
LWRLVTWWLFAVIALHGIEITPQTTRITLLPHAQIFFDPARSTTIDTIQTRSFKPVTQKRIGFGYAPDRDIWVQIDLRNPTDKPLQRILEYSHPLTTHIKLYDGRTHTLIAEDGLLHNVRHRQTLNPHFVLTLPPHASQIYYLKASSTVTALVLQLDLWEPEAFYNHALYMRSLLALFFGAMFIIVIYNLIIYFVTGESSYLYYVLFFAFVTLHQFSYRGVAALILPTDTIRLLVDHATYVVAAPVFFLMLFTGKILRLKQYPKLSRFMHILFWLFPISIVMMQLLEHYRFRAPLSVSMFFVLFAITLYALYRRNVQARYLTLGWALFWTAALMMYLSNIGVYDIFSRVPFYTELTLVTEALIFALSLAMMIRQTNQEKLEAQQQYIDFQAEEEQRLTREVTKRTQQLSQSLQEKDVLLKELNHRVKNSIQTIVSFLRLQIDDTEDNATQKALTVIENRILAINHLYALLNTRENLIHVDAHTYFDLLATTIQKSFRNRNTAIDIHTTVQLPAQTAIYCGFIINEALTNAFQHAFGDDEQGHIALSLSEQESLFRLQIQDNGKGFDPSQTFTSLGLTILKSLATVQLKGTLHIASTDGTTITITWEKGKDA